MATATTLSVQGTYHLNQETQRVELHFSKSDFQALPADTQQEVKRTCLWSGKAGAWVSRTRQPLLSGHYSTVRLAQRLGLTEEATEGELLSLGEQQEQRQERAEARADRYETRADRATEESTRRYQGFKDELSVIPMGQPILVGHHSERGHRARLSRADNHMRASIAADDKAKHYSDRAEAATHTAAARELKDPAFLTRRIKEHSANLRRCERHQAAATTESTRAHYAQWVEVYREKVAYYTELLAAAGGSAHTPDGMIASRAGYVLYSGTWYPLVRLANKSVTICNWHGIADLTWSVAYAEIKAVRPLDAPEQVFDRDGQPVAPRVKYRPAKVAKAPKAAPAAPAPAPGLFDAAPESLDSPVEALRAIVQNHSADHVQGVLVDLFSASTYVQVYDNLNEANRAKLVSLPIQQGIGLVFKLVNR